MNRPLGWLLTAACLARALPALSAEKGRIDVAGLDPAVELNAVVERLSLGAEARSAADIPYLQAADAAFLSGKADPVQERRGHDFLNALLYLDAPPGLGERFTIPGSIVQQLGGRRRFAAWLEGLRAFAARSHFMDFFAAHEASLEPSVAAFRKAVQERDYLGKIERYAGLPFEGRYRIVLSPFYSEGAQVNTVAPRADGSYEIATLFGRGKLLNGAPDFLSDDVPTTAWHELGHGIMDVLSDIYRPEIARKSSWYGAIAGGCYGEWQQCVKEHVVRAVMIRLVARDLGDARAEKVLETEGNAKYPYLKAMTERLKEYEAHRDRYPTLADFYGELLRTIPEPAKGGEAFAESLPLPAPGSGLRWVVSTAVAFPATGQRLRAVRLLGAMLRVSADDALYLRRAELLYHLERYGDAEADLGLVLRERPDLVEALLLRALSRRALGDHAGARTDLLDAARACAAAAEVPETACQDARFWLARDSKPKAAAAMTVGEASVPTERARPPDTKSDPDVLRQQAEELFGRGDTRRALEKLDGAAAADGSDPQVWMDRGVVLHALGRPLEALKSYARALDLARTQRLPGDLELIGDTLSSRASQLREQGDDASAREDLAAALKAAPHFWLRRVETEQELRTWEARQSVVPATFRPDPQSAVSNAIVSSDGKYLVTTTEAGTADLWDLARGRRVHRFEDVIQTMHPAAFTPDGKFLLLWREDFTGRLWDLERLREVRTFKGYGQTVYAVAFTPDGRYFVTAAFDHTARLWDAASGRQVRVFKGHPGTLEALAISPEGRLLATLSFGVVRLWDISTGRLLRTFKSKQGWVLSMAFSPDGGRLAAGCSDFSIQIWEVGSGRRLAMLYGHFDGVDGVAFTRDGKRLLSASRDETARLWDLAAGKPIRAFSGHTSGVRTVTLASDDRLLITGGWDGTTRFWDVATGRELARLVSSEAHWAVLSSSGDFEGSPESFGALQAQEFSGTLVHGLLPLALGLGTVQGPAPR